jgi:predicted metal-dependent enzyme (double-stranded beta helix superfamily)
VAEPMRPLKFRAVVAITLAPSGMLPPADHRVNAVCLSASESAATQSS